jgi:polyribonucleotide nucleotidyltransferase
MASMSFIGVKDDQKQNLPGPRLETGKIYTGEISSVTRFGVFIRFGNDKIGYREGLLHISQISQKKEEQNPFKFENITSIAVKILKMDQFEHIDLSLID